MGVGITTRRTRSQRRSIAWLGVVLCIARGWFTLHGTVFTLHGTVFTGADPRGVHLRELLVVSAEQNGVVEPAAAAARARCACSWWARAPA